jgi:hypothetical protein
MPCSKNGCVAKIGTPYVIFEVIAALKVSNSLIVQWWLLRPAA